MKKNCFRIVISFFTLFSLVLTPLVGSTVLALPPFLGTGTTTNPFQISTCEDLISLSATHSYFDDNIILTTTLDCESNGNDIMISTEEFPFTGNFDGQGNSINVSIGMEEDYVGLFRVLDGATISNLDVNGSIISTEDYVGSLAGDVTGGATITGVSSSADVTGHNGVGGLVGALRNYSTITDTFATGSVTSEYGLGAAVWTGGLVGYFADSTIERTYAIGSVNGYDRVGGLVGHIEDNEEIGEPVPSIVAYSFSNSAVQADAADPDFASVIGSVNDGLVVLTENYYDWDLGVGPYTCGYSDGIIISDSEGCIGVDTSEDPTYFFDIENAPYTVDSGAEWNANEFPMWKFSEDDYPVLWAMEEQVGFDGEGEGTTEFPYIISTCEELENVDYDMYAYYSVEPEDESTVLDCTEIGNPAMIRSNISSFKGNFDGNNVNIIVSIHYNGSYVGLFSRADRATITNVIMSGDIIGEGEYVGGAIGYAEDSTITDSSSSAPVINYSDDTDIGENTGGFAGEIQSSTVDNCFSTGDVTSTTLDVGGFTGDIDDSEVTNSYSTGDVSGYSYVGGFVGDSDTDATFDQVYSVGNVTAEEDHIGGLIGDAIDIDIARSYATGDVTSVGDDVGGLVGRLRTSNIANTYAMGDVEGDENIGGLVGLSEEEGSIIKSYSVGLVTGETSVGGLIGAFSDSDIDFNFWDTETSGQDESAAGIGRTTLEMKNIDTFTTLNEDPWDFDTIWEIDNEGILNSGYPYFIGQTLPYVLTEVTPIPSEISTLEATYYYTAEGEGEAALYVEECGHASEVQATPLGGEGSITISGLEYGETYECAFNVISNAGSSNSLFIGPFTVISSSHGGSSGSRSKTKVLTYEQEVAQVLEDGIVTNSPEGLTNKCEALTMISRVFEWNVPTAASSKYTDVPEWCTDVAAFGTDRGVVEGRTETTLGMETPVTRYEVATMIFRELDIRDWKFEGTVDAEFSDELIAWAKESVLALAKEGVVKGFANGAFGGEKYILKQDLGIMLLRLI